jgi:pyruvate formate lyase activating enzyme
MHDALLGSREGEKVRCGLCLHRCLIPEGGRGVCGVRGVIEGRLRALTYGLVSSLAADPVEKKPVFHFCPGTLVLSLGSVGCTMRCGHCQNWQISRPKGDDGSVSLSFLDPDKVVRLAAENRCAGVAFTYNEPVIWLEYVIDAARAAKDAGLYTIMVTNGWVTPEGLDLFAEVIDVWRVDVKAHSEEPHRRLCHVAHPEAVREQAERALHVHGMHVECVTNIVPTINDSAEELEAIAGWIAQGLSVDTPWHVTRFQPYLEFSHLAPTPLETLELARDIGKRAGLRHVFLGNVLAHGGEDTVCPRCGAVAVKRRGYSVLETALAENGSCAACGMQLGIVTRACGDGAERR